VKRCCFAAARTEVAHDSVTVQEGASTVLLDYCTIGCSVGAVWALSVLIF